VAVVALSCADRSTELSGVSHVPRRPTEDVNHFLARSRLGAALAMTGAHTLWAWAFVQLAVQAACVAIQFVIEATAPERSVRGTTV